MLSGQTSQPLTPPEPSPTRASANTVIPANEAGIEPDLEFTDIQSLHAYVQKIRSETDRDAVVVHGLKQDDFTAIFHARKEDSRARYFYLEEKKLLIITLPTLPHERLHFGLYEAFLDDRSLFMPRKTWFGTAAATYPSGTPGQGSSGEGDSGGKPKPEANDRTWPTIVFEGGYSQSMASLRAKMQFWFAASDHQVKIVVLAKAYPNDRQNKRILLEQWVEQEDGVRIGATNTRYPVAESIAPLCEQTINIVWASDTPYDNASDEQKRDADSINVSKGPLSFDFSRVHLRAPRSPVERDVVISEEDLRTYAAEVWEFASLG